MADADPKLKVVEGGAAAEAAQEGKEEAVPKKRRLPIPSLPPVAVKIAVIVLVVLVMAVVSWVVITKILAPKLETPPEEPPKVEEPKPEPPGPVFSVSELIVNPASSVGRRFLKVGVAFETENEKVVEEMTLREPQIRDLLIRELSSRTADELADPVLREEVRASIVEHLNEILTTGKVKALYFTDYILQ
jgi:flagellar FliL protein